MGLKENDITYSLGWALAQSPTFCRALLEVAFPNVTSLGVDHVSLQRFEDDGGFTDIELAGDGVHVIVEAKRGWELPGIGQLEKYAKRLHRRQAAHSVMLSMSECSGEYASRALPARVLGVPVKHLAWREVCLLASRRRGSHAERRLLAQICTYFGRIIRMQDQTSNLVYVVALGSGKPPWSPWSWVEFVTKRRCYFHPVGGGWPKQPPNYLGFRYGGALQSIHHVEGWRIVTELDSEIPGLSLGNVKPHYLYALGLPIVPQKTVRTGKVYPSGKTWAMLDLLLTCDTVSEARDRTNARLATSSVVNER